MSRTSHCIITHYSVQKNSPVPLQAWYRKLCTNVIEVQKCCSRRCEYRDDIQCVGCLHKNQLNVLELCLTSGYILVSDLKVAYRFKLLTVPDKYMTSPLLINMMRK